MPPPRTDTAMNARTVIVSLGASAALAAGTFGFAIPALAAPASIQAESCGSNRTCMYSEGGYINNIGERPPNAVIDLFSANANDRLTSWINTSYTNARFRYDAYDRGTCVNMKARSRASASATNPDNDKASSANFARGCPP